MSRGEYFQYTVGFLILTATQDPYLWIANPGAASRAQSRLAELQHQLSSRDRLQKNFKRLRELLGTASS